MPMCEIKQYEEKLKAILNSEAKLYLDLLLRERDGRIAALELKNLELTCQINKLKSMHY